MSTVAIKEPGRPLAAPPTTTAEPGPGGSAAGTSEPGEGGWSISGRKAGVAHAEGDVLVTADQGLFLVHGPPATPEFASTGEPTATITLDRTPAERVAGPEAVEERAAAARRPPIAQAPPACWPGRWR